MKGATLRPYSSTFKAQDMVVKHSSRLKPVPPTETLSFGESITDHMLHVQWNMKTGWEAPSIIEYQGIPIKPSISALHYGISVFEGLKGYKCEEEVLLFRPLDHFRRLKRSALRMCLPEFDENELLRCVFRLVDLERNWVPKELNSSLYIRPVMFATEETMKVKIPHKATLVIMVCPVGPYFGTGTIKPVALMANSKWCRSWHGGTGNIKTSCNYGPTLFSQRDAESKGCSQVLWVDEKKDITEIGTMNFFALMPGSNNKVKLITPPLSDLVLGGITRQSILELAITWNDVTVEEVPISLKKLLKLNQQGQILEIFGSGTACVVSPVDRILYKDQWHQINTRNESESFASRIRKELEKIQRGVVKSDWACVVPRTVVS